MWICSSRTPNSTWERAQCPPEEREEFQDIERYRYFNTNNLWVDLVALEKAMEEGGLELAQIINRKELDGVKVVQLESAMGAVVAIRLS